MVGERLLTVAQAAQVLHLSVAGTYGTIAEIKAVFGFGRHNTRTRTSAIPTSVGALSTHTLPDAHCRLQVAGAMSR